MPWIDPDPWEAPILEALAPAGEVAVPASDPAAWSLNPKHRWVYDKLRLYERLGIEAGPAGTEPEGGDLILKPVVNLWGMGMGVRRVCDREPRPYLPGHLWMWAAEPGLLHLSIDIAVHDGRPLDWWVTHCAPDPARLGVFKHFRLLRQDQWPEVVPLMPGQPDLESGIGAALGLVDRCLSGYSGMVNVEVIGETVIEAHLRMTTQWAALYGPVFLRTVVALYRGDPEPITWVEEPEGFSVPVWLPGRPTEIVRDAPYPPELLTRAAAFLAIAEDGRPDEAQPPGATRVGVVNAHSLDYCRQLARVLRWYCSGAALAEPAE